MQSSQNVPGRDFGFADCVEHAFHFHHLVQHVSTSLLRCVACSHTFFSYVAVAAIVACLMLYSCSSSLYNSLIVCFCDRETMQRSFFISTILSNAFSCILLLIIALILGGQNPTIGFTRDTYILSALLSLAFAYPLWLYVPEPEGDTLTEPITLSTSVTAVINGAQALAKNRYITVC
jgi:MFS-type transporter involved in bile tolerance (Atg22 family)